MSALRLQGQVSSPSQVDEAYFEPNGNISVIQQQREPRVIDIRIENGVQTVRIQLD